MFLIPSHLYFNLSFSVSSYLTVSLILKF
jgi:hypothetical protein